jgi:nitrous oxidase accessory protein
VTSRRIALVVTCTLAVVTALPGQQAIVVRTTGPVTSVAAALQQARDGDRIVITAGTWLLDEPLMVTHRVTIEGEGWPALQGAGGHELMRVTSDSVRIRGLVFRNVRTSFIDDRAAIRFIEVEGCAVEDSHFEATFFGIYLQASAGCRITGNRFTGGGTSESGSGNAVHLWNSSRTLIADNAITRYRDGIYLEFARHVEVLGNESEANFRYGLHFMFSDSCAYRDNQFRRNGAGIAVMYSKHVDLTANVFEYNWGAGAYGLLLKDITDGQLAGNRFTGNSTALFLEGSSRLLIRGNIFDRNGWAIKLMANAEGNRFEDNTFSGNSFDVATNSRSNASVFDANSWDHYQGYDLDRDGYGDVPYAPVRLFSLIVQQNEPALILMRSFMVDLLEAAERVLPVLTPATLVDHRPRLRAAP